MIYLFTVFFSVALVAVYRLGIYDGQKKALDIPIISRPEKEKAPTREELILKNIENYSGDERGQSDIE